MKATEYQRLTKMIKELSKKDISELILMGKIIDELIECELIGRGIIK